MSEKFKNYLTEAMSRGASDIHLSVNSKPIMRIDGELVRFDDENLSEDNLNYIVEGILDLKQYEELKEKGEVDLSYTVQGLSRFRLNVYKQRDVFGIAARAIPFEVPTIDKLELPSVIKKIARNDKGIVIVTGPTGSGKSSTLSAMINYINENFSKHIVTLEDPIEFLHENKRCLVEQRQVGQDTMSFDSGLRAALRQDPDIIFIGEMRDPETIKAALTAAETGHLVFGSLHTQTAPSTIDRIIDSFPSDAQPQIRNQLANSLKAVVAQRLVKRKDGGRIAATEILINTVAIQNLIRNEKVHQIKNVLQMGSGDGMRTLEKSVQMLIEQGSISDDVLFDLNITLDL